MSRTKGGVMRKRNVTCKGGQGTKRRQENQDKRGPSKREPRDFQNNEERSSTETQNLKITHAWAAGNPRAWGAKC